MTDEQKSLVMRLKGHSEIMERDKGKFVRFIDVATCTEAIDEIDALRAENTRLREALVKLRDCDWVISLPDRMDAVRDIARAALTQATSHE